MSIEMEPLVRLSTVKVDKQDEYFDSQMSDGSVYENLQNPAPLTSRSDPGTEHNKPQFVKAHRRGGSYIPGGYNFAANNTKVPLPKSKLEQLGSAFPAKKIEVASLAIKSAAQRSSVLHIERSISSPLPAVSSHLMRPSVGRWRPNNGLHDIDIHRQSNSQFARTALSNGSSNRSHIVATKPRPNIVKQEDTEESSRRKTVTWCELTEVHEFVHTDSQNKDIKPVKAIDQSAKGDLTEKKPAQESQAFKDDNQVFVKDISFGNQSLPPLDMNKLQIVTASQLSKCVDTDSDISISSPSSEDSMPFTDAPEVPELPDAAPAPESQQYKRSSRISRDDVLSRLAELKKNRSEEDAFEAINMTKDKPTTSDAEQIVNDFDEADSKETSDITANIVEASSVAYVDQADPPIADKPTLTSVQIPETKLAISDRFASEETLTSAMVPPRPKSSSGIPTKPKSNTNAASASRPMDLSEWYKQRKRMERVRREQVINGKYDFDMDEANANVQKEKDNETPMLLGESSRRATYTEGVTNMIPLTTNRPGVGFEKSLLEDFERIAEGQKPKGYRERRISKVVVASADFEKAGGADQAITDALAIKAAKINVPADVMEAYDDSAQSIHSIESTANFAPRPWMERRRSMDLLSRSSPDSSARGRLYIKVIAAQDLDFPFPSRDMEARCVLNEGTYEHTSPSRRLSRNTEFGHEFKLETHDFLDFTITIHVKHPDTDRSTTLSRILSTQRKPRAEGLSKYINNDDGALAQVRISFQDIMSECQSKICTATFHLVNGWYKDAGLPLINSRNRMARRPIREKVVGKLIVKLAYLPGVDPQVLSSTKLRGL
ncbi:hypothetical protein BC943DRAFT_102698 [Umbelopsis sp. AD052]|nr:hypothetical protein BC943DRAFT_102698 [Umbelopsis sp. AD052]